MALKMNGGGELEPIVYTANPLIRAFDRKAKGYLKALQRSFSSSALDRNSIMLGEEDPSAMTIEFLRARLQSQRADYRAEKQRAQVLAKKVLELEHKLSIEVHLRKRAEHGHVDASTRHDSSESIGPHHPLSSSGEVDVSSEEREEQSYNSDSRPRQLISSSDGPGNDTYTDGDEEGHITVPPSWQCCGHCGGPGHSHNRKKGLCQSPKHLCPGLPSRRSHKKEYNAFSADKDSHERSKPMGRWIHKRMRESRGRLAGYSDCHAIHTEQHESGINAVQMKYEKQENEQQEAGKAFQPCEHQNSLISQFQGCDAPQHAKKLSIRMGREEGLPKSVQCQTIKSMNVKLQQSLEDMNAQPSQNEICEILEASTFNQDICNSRELEIETPNAISERSTRSYNDRPCYNDTGTGSISRISELVSDRCKPQYQASVQANLDVAVEKQDKALTMSTKVFHEIHDEKGVHHSGVIINNQTPKRLEISTPMPMLMLDRFESKDTCSRQVISDEGSTLLPQGVLQAGPVRSHDVDLRQPHYNVTTLTKRMEPGHSSSLYRAAVPSQFSDLEEDQFLSQATHLIGHLRSIDRRFYSVTEMLKVLELANKQQGQTANEPTMSARQLKLANEGGRLGAKQAAIVRSTGSRHQLARRCQRPSRFFVERAAPKHLHFNPALQQQYKEDLL